MNAAPEAVLEQQAEPPFDDVEGRARPLWFTAITYWGLHVACLGAFWTGVTVEDLALFAGTYVVRVLGVMGGYHRYFSHRSFKTSRAMQLFMAALGCLGAHRGVLWWASHHRHHHRYSDTRRDIFSPLHRSFYYAHTGWALDAQNAETDLERVPDLAAFPELVWLDRWNLVPWVLTTVAITYVFGWSGFVWGVCMSTVLNWHAVHCIGSLSHQYGGYRRYATPDNSRNKWWLALLLLGEWHNNHHYYAASARMGFLRWELDPIWWMLRALRAVGLVWDVREIPQHLIDHPDASQSGVRRLLSWLLGLRKAIARCVDEAGAEAGREANAVALALVRHALDDRVDDFESAALDLSVLDPEQLAGSFAALRAGVRDEIRKGSLPEPLASNLDRSVTATVAEHGAACPFGHFLRQRTET